jgi:hypothetical protein
VDAVVLTGISHFSPSDASLPSLIPANQDPQFARRSLDDDYLNHGAGVTESQLPFRTDDPARPSAHGARRSREGDGTTAELRTASAVLTSGASSAIRVPVLMMAGQFDPGVCGGASICASPEASAAAFAVAEAPFFAADACLETAVDLWHAKHSPKAT